MQRHPQFAGRTPTPSLSRAVTQSFAALAAVLLLFAAVTYAACRSLDSGIIW